MFGSKLTRANQRAGDGKGAGLDRETGGGGQAVFGCQGPKNTIRHSTHGESLKSRVLCVKTGRKKW